MNRLYSSPLRVYLCLGFLALVGIYCGLHLPVSLFPNSSKPMVRVNVGYGSGTAEEFLNAYGRSLESQLRGISTGLVEVDKLTASYEGQMARYETRFKWGVPYREALREVQTVVNAFAGRFPKEIRDKMWISSGNDNTGFLAISFYSDTRDLDGLYKYLEPLLTPKMTAVHDGEELELWNPSRKEIQIELDPDKMASLQLLPRDIQSAVVTALNGSGGGTVKAGLGSLDVSLNRQAGNLDELGRTLIHTPKGNAVHLSEIARMDLGAPLTHNHSFKTSGAPSLILFATPRAGGNVKRMAEEILQIVREMEPALPSDIHYKVLVDPSEFIRSAVNNVLHEVVLAALLAVLVLFLFIGSIKNVATAAIEIPMSIVLAFILMKITGINLNLISLGGLALSAGMNVDASVVVMENIFRHFDQMKGPLSFSAKKNIVMQAVSEVRFPIIASTIASLVVFLPLAFTSGMSHGLLSDLALAVVFSHGFSAVVALVLVPTVRLQLMSSESNTVHRSPIEGLLKKLEAFYASALKRFITTPALKYTVYGACAVSLAALIGLALPKLPKEIIGRPDTDWIILSVHTEGNKSVKQMESQAEEIEAGLIKKFGQRVQYTFTQVHQPNGAHIMARLKNKKDMQTIWKGMESHFSNTPFLHFYVIPWNPSELEIPDPPQMELALRGGTALERTLIARDLSDLFEEKKVFKNIFSTPNVKRRESIVLTPNFNQWSALQKGGARLSPLDLTEISRVATDGQRIGELPVEGTLVPIVMQYPANRVNSVEDLGQLPVGVNGKLVPFKALAGLSVKEMAPAVYRENEKELILVQGKVKKGEESQADSAIAQSRALLDDWREEKKDLGTVSVSFEDSMKELNESLNELGKALAISVLLIFLTMVFQFGDVVNALLVLVAVPLGFIGVLSSLLVFKSTLSLNSVLGVILLNGIAVANSIILVDFLKRLVDRGLSPREAALEAAGKRLRPIIMTSLTTGLGMLPVALGFGEGGRILQPLGIAVIGGLGFSMTMTLFIVPTLQVAYLEWRQGDQRPQRPVVVRSPQEMVQ